MGPYGSPSSSSASTPLFATPSHFSGSANYNPHRSYYFNGNNNVSEGSSSSNDPNFKQRRRNLRGRAGIFGSSSSPTLALVPTLLRAVLLSPLLVLVLYLTFRTKGGSSSGQLQQQQQRWARNSPAMAKTYYDHGAHKSASSSSSTTNQYNDCMRGATYYEHGALKRDACRQQAMMMQASYTTSATSSSASNETDGDAAVLLLPPPPILQQQQLPQQQQQSLMLVQEDQEGSLPMMATSGVLDATIVRPKPQPKRQVANYYNPMMEATSSGGDQPQSEGLFLPLAAPVQMMMPPQQQQLQRVIVEPSHLNKGDAQPLQFLTSGGGGDGSTTTLLLVQQQQEEPLQEPSPPMLLSSEEALAVPALQRPPIPLQSTGAADGLELPSVEMRAPAAQSWWRRKPRNQKAADNADLRNNNAAAAVAYYYYDPRQVRTDARTGQMVLPEVVYDSSGGPHLLANLRARQVWVDTATAASPSRQSATANLSPPMGMASATVNAAAAAAAAPANLVGIGSAATTTNTVTMVGSNLKTSSSSGGLPQWGESTATDQSIIVCTVGLMALLVGAVSARRFRRQSILSACIENEALDSSNNHNHDYSYDNTGYGSGTHPYGAPGQSSSYKTFEGWKGDLEKFDV
jgi:hypothetical protein